MATYLITTRKYYPKSEDTTETITADRVEFTHNEHGYTTSARFYNRVPAGSPLAYGEELILMVQSPSRVEKVVPAAFDHDLANRLQTVIDRLEKFAKDHA